MGSNDHRTSNGFHGKETEMSIDGIDANRLLVTGSGGLIGSAVCRVFLDKGWTVHGVDNDQRGELFGTSVAPVIASLTEHGEYHHWDFDIRQVGQWPRAMADAKPNLIVHAAGQPSHDWAAGNPLADFDINAAATLHILEACRREAPRARFVFTSTNKVYGTRPNLYEDGVDGSRLRTSNTIAESERIDQTMHSLFGCSKAAADLYVQEYLNYYGLDTFVLRLGCVTGPDHAGAEAHGFLNYLFRCCRDGRPYTVFGFSGLQVRDQLHVMDVANAIEHIQLGPKATPERNVYNLGGGRENSVSVVEAIQAAERLYDTKMKVTYSPTARKADHLVYITDHARFRGDYPDWTVRWSLDAIYNDLFKGS
jgi:CDP-paratose 2-epimerase